VSQVQIREQPFSLKVREVAPASGDRWSGGDEASGSDLWDLLSTPTVKRRSVARTFAATVTRLDEVQGVWLTDSIEDLGVSIALTDSVVESWIREVFIDLVCKSLDPAEGELSVFPADQVPVWVENSEKLT